MKHTVWRSNKGQGFPLVVSFWTDEFYRRDAYELVRTCQLFNLDYEVMQQPDLGSWEANTNAKAHFLLAAHHRHPHRGLLWVDADARFRQDPSDLVCLGPQHLVAFHLWRGRSCASGTVLFRALPGRQELLEQWCRGVTENPDATDQVELSRACVAQGVQPFDLPVEYCWIYDIDAETLERGERLDSRPVIEHLQSSRWARRCPKCRVRLKGNPSG